MTKDELADLIAYHEREASRHMDEACRLLQEFAERTVQLEPRGENVLLEKTWIVRENV
jgi:hypothetical protein